MTTAKAVQHTPGAMRAAKQVYSAKWPIEVLAAIIDRETGAPEMLEALEAIAANPIVEGMSARIRDHASQNGIPDAFVMVEAAIQKAKGGAQ